MTNLDTSNTSITRIERAEGNKIEFALLNPRSDCEYAFYVYQDDSIVIRTGYSESSHGSYWAIEKGKYRVEIFERPKAIDERKAILDTYWTDEIYFEGVNLDFNRQDEEKGFLLFHNVFVILKEVVQNSKRIFRLSRFDYALENKDSYLEKFWDVLNPLIQIGTFWFVFGIGMRNNRDVEGIPYLVWMLCGLIPWFFFSSCVVRGANSIYSRSSIIRKIKYPISTIPIEEMLVQLYEHVVVLGILFITLFFYGYYPDRYWSNLLYYLLYEIFFLTSFSMLTSALTMVARDFQKAIASLIRLWFYLTPILWSMENLPISIQHILKLNPALYVVDGFRDSLLYHLPFYMHPTRMGIMWAVNIILLVVGTNIQVRLRGRFVDML